MTRYAQVARLIHWLKPRTIVEVGTWNGGRAMEMAEAALIHRDRVHYWGFDLFEAASAETDARELNVKPHHRQAEVAAWLAAFAAGHPGFTYDLVGGDTRETLAGGGAFAEADFAFIDGGHSVETVAADYAALAGCRTVLLDDYYVPDAAGRSPDTARVGCNSLAAGLDHLILPARDPVAGGGVVQMVLTGSLDVATARRTALVTSFNAEGYAAYGERFLASAGAHLPAEIPIHVYTEGVEIPESDRVRPVDLLAAAPELVRFKARHADNPAARGVLADGDYGYRRDAVRFAHKTFAIIHAAATLDAEVLFWIDADTYAVRDIPGGLFDALLPPGAYTSYLGRPGTYPECGLVGYDLTHDANGEFMAFWKSLYAEDLIFELPEWHDSFVYDVVRRTFEAKGRFVSHDMAAEAPVSDHPFVNSLVGLFMDHLKGDERKARGRSFDDDYLVERI